MRIECGDGILLRPFQQGDQEALVRLGNNYNVSKWLTNLFPHPYRLEDADSWVAHNMGEAARYSLAIDRGAN